MKFKFFLAQNLFSSTSKIKFIHFKLFNELKNIQSNKNLGIFVFLNCAHVLCHSLNAHQMLCQLFDIYFRQLDCQIPLKLTSLTKKKYIKISSLVLIKLN